MLPQEPYTLHVEYTDAELGGLAPGTLALYYWDGSQWLREPSSVVDPAARMVSATPVHIGVWVILGQ